MSPKIGLIDYGSGNFTSVWNAFSQHGRELVAVTEHGQFRECSHLVLPGVGAFSTAIGRLQQMRLLDPLRELVQAGTTPFLGICVGMQILAAEGAEFEPTSGLGVVEGIVNRFDFSSLAAAPPLPHMGWNDVIAAPGSVLFKGIDPQEPSFYFVHSYHLQSDDPTARFSHCVYGGRFIAALEKSLVFGVQFHPEKSQRNGRQVIANFLGVNRG
jgi:glutamine amidotransferase